MSQHAKLAPSASERWIACPGSIQLQDKLGVKSVGSAAASEGTRAHALLNAILVYWNKTKEPENGLLARFRKGTSFTWEDHGKVHKDTVDQETLDYVMVAVEYVLNIMTPKAKLYLEEHVTLNHIRPGMGGTADIIIIRPDIIHVMDYKHGFTPVRVQYNELNENLTPEKINTQLMIYAAGAIKKFNLTGPVKLSIIQPRAMEVEPIQMVGLTVQEIVKWSENALFEAACNTEMADAPLVAGDHCRFCPCASQCPALAEKNMLVAGQDFKEFRVVKIDRPMQLPAPPMNPIELGRILKAAPLIDTWLRECEATAQRLMGQGQEVPGFKLVRKRSNREWPTENPNELFKLLRKAGLKIPKAADLLKAPEVMSPAQVEAAYGKRDSSEAVNTVAKKAEGGITIAASSDKRPAVQGAITDFAGFASADIALEDLL